MLTPREIAQWVKESPYAKFIEPSAGDVHVNRPLTEILINWQQDPMGFVADRAFPIVQVDKRSDEYWEYDMGSLFRDDMKERTPGTEGAGSTHQISTQNYACRNYALYEDIPDEVRANQDMPLNEDSAMTMILGQKARIHRERTWIASYFAGSAWTYSADGATAGSGANFNPKDSANNQLVYWSADNSTPIQDVRLAAQYIGLSGVRPNVLILGRPVADILYDHEDIIMRLDRGQTPGQPAKANKDDLARLFELDEVLVMDSVYNMANIGASANNSYIGGKHALLAYRAPRPNRVVPSAGYTFAWRGILGATPDGTRIRRFRMEQLQADRIQIQSYYDQKKVAADLGFFFNGIIQ